jgi:hypothetical protein
VAQGHVASRGTRASGLGARVPRHD